MLIPVNGQITIKKTELKNPGGIILPDTVEFDFAIAEVIATSEDFIQGGVVRKMFVNVGDKVVYNPRYEVKFDVEGEKQLLIAATAVVAIIREE